MQRVMRRVGSIVWIAVTVCAFVAGACDEKAAAPAGEPYALTLTPPPAGKVGGAVAAQLELVPKGIYKINLEYPTKLSIEVPPGVETAKRVMVATDATKIDGSQVIFTPRTTLKTAGEHRIDAVFKFSLCTAKHCELKAEKLSWVASASE